MNKTKLIIIGLAIGVNIALAARYAYVEYLWTYKRPIVQEVHTTQQFINGTNSTVSQNVETKKRDKWFGWGPYVGRSGKNTEGGIQFMFFY